VNYRFFAAIVFAFALGVLVRDQAQDYTPQAASCERARENADVFGRALAAAALNGGAFQTDDVRVSCRVVAYSQGDSMNDMVVHEQPRALTVGEVRGRVNLIQQVMGAVMKRGTHYDTIPGTDKPSLLKPGAEVLVSTFMIAVNPEVEDLSSADEIRYRVRCVGTHQSSGIVIGAGIGECSSGEEKYKWRRAVCDEEFDAAEFDRKRTKYARGKNNSHYTIKQVRTEPADVANTVLKMAKKRALVDFTLTALAASDIFAQDLEDLPEEVREAVTESDAGKRRSFSSRSPSRSQGTAGDRPGEEDQRRPGQPAPAQARRRQRHGGGLLQAVRHRGRARHAVRQDQRGAEIPHGAHGGMISVATQPIEFNEARHEYRLDGAVVPSVTQLLEPIRRELGGMQNVLEYKRSVGKALDRAIELHEKDDLDFATLDVGVVPFFEAWIAFKRDSGFRVLLNQLVVYSRKLRFAGTLDVLGHSRRGPSPDELIDTKCVWTIDPATAIQTAAYALAAHESHGIKVKRRGGLQLLRDGTYRFYPYNDPLDENVVRAMLVVNSWKALHRK
jgi:hypothetical protein